MIETCTCDPIPVVSSLESKPGAVVKDFVDDDGRWHVVVLNYDEAKNTGEVRKQTLLVPSAAYIAAHPPRTPDEIAAIVQSKVDEATTRDALDAIRQKRRDGLTLTSAEQHKVFDFMLGV